MATTSKALFRGAASTSNTTLYTTPASTTTIVTDIVVTNTSTSAGTFTVNLNGVAIASGATVNGNDSTIIQIKQPIAATQTISGSASATTINFHIAGVEVV